MRQNRIALLLIMVLLSTAIGCENKAERAKALENERKKAAEEYATNLESEKKKIVEEYAKNLESEKKKIAEEYAQTLESDRKQMTEELLSSQEADKILDDEFTQKFFEGDYKKLQDILNKMIAYEQDIRSYKESISQKASAVSPADAMLVLKAAEAVTISNWVILSAGDMVVLFARSTDQYGDFNVIKARLDRTVKYLAYYIGVLNDIMSTAKNSAHQMTYSNLRDRIREAKQILDALSAAMSEKYESAKKAREKEV